MSLQNTTLGLLSMPKHLYALYDRQEVLRYSTSPGHEASSGTNP